MDSSHEPNEASALAAATAWSTPPLAYAVACSDIGRKRQNNEDSFLLFDLSTRALHPGEVQVDSELEPPGLLLAVADGMGGHQSGQLASQICIDTITAEFLAALDHASETQGEWTKTLVRTAEAANQQVSQVGRDNPEHHGMGTTLTAALLTAHQVIVAQVGDSRAYLLHQGALTQLTRDQTIANSLLSLHQDLKTDSHFAEMLVQAVGVVEKLDVEVTEAAVEPGDCLLICCDGLYKAVGEANITAVLESDGPLITRTRELIAQANAAGGPDNITVVLAELRKNPTQAA